MFDSIKRWLLTGLLLVVCLLLVIFNIVDFIIGPADVPTHAMNQTVDLYEKANDQEVSEILNRFSLEHVYLLVKVQNEIVVLMADGSVVYETDYVDLPTSMDYYGYYDKDVVFVQKDDNTEVFYDIDTLNEIFRLELGGI